MSIRYAIITNPAAGKMSVDEKRAALAEPSEILNAEIHGLDTLSSKDFKQCASELANRCDVLVTAGGDGTFSEIINTVDTAHTPVAHLPLGTGNAMRHALKYKGGLADIAMRIREGETREYDLIHCDEKKRAFMASIGLEGTIIRLRDRYRAQGTTGFNAYFSATLKAYFRDYRRTGARIIADGTAFEIEDLLTMMVVKQPYYGFGMKVVPKARFDDRRLHVLCINSGLVTSLIGGITAFTFGNRIGRHLTCRQLLVELGRPLAMQIDGDRAWDANAFRFKILPRALKIKC